MTAWVGLALIMLGVGQLVLISLVLTLRRRVEELEHNRDASARMHKRADERLDELEKRKARAGTWEGRPS